MSVVSSSGCAVVSSSVPVIRPVAIIIAVSLLSIFSVPAAYSRSFGFISQAFIPADEIFVLIVVPANVLRRNFCTGCFLYLGNIRPSVYNFVFFVYEDVADRARIFHYLGILVYLYYRCFIDLSCKVFLAYKGPVFMVEPVMRNIISEMPSASYPWRKRVPAPVIAAVTPRNPARSPQITGRPNPSPTG